MNHVSYFPNVRHLWQTLGLAEMQCVVAGTSGYDLTGQSILGVLQPQLMDKSSTLRIVMKKTKCGASAPRLLDKLEALSSADQNDLALALHNLHSQFDPIELLGESGWPDPSVLRASGFVAPTSPVATAYCVFVLHDDDYTHEMVLYNKLETIADQGQISMHERAVAAVRLVKLLRSDDRRQEDNDWLAWLCYQLVAKVGSPYLRIEEKHGTVSVTPIPAAHLRSDLADKGLRSLTLAGINAPEVA